jgi:hypothetical protein
LVVCGGRRRRAARCQVAGCLRPHVALCDHPMPNGKDCDVRICDRHRLVVGVNDDRCPYHALELLEVKD